MVSLEAHVLLRLEDRLPQRLSCRLGAGGVRDDERGGDRGRGADSGVGAHAPGIAGRACPYFAVVVEPKLQGPGLRVGSRGSSGGSGEGEREW